MKSLTALFAALVLAASSGAQSAADFGLLNSGSLRADGSNPYSVTSASVSGTFGLYVPASTVWPVNGPWLDNSGTAQWLALYSGTTPPAATAEVPTVPAGDFQIGLTFDLASVSPGAVSFEIQAAADNNLSLSLNDSALANLGTVDGSTNYGELGHYRYLVDATTLRPGLNTLQFTLTNAAGATGNPAGLYVEYSNLTVIPEPSTYALFLGLGTLTLAAFTRRFRR